MSFLFSSMAAFAILTDGLLRGKLPKALGSDASTLFEGGLLALGILSLVTALREAHLHKGMEFNGYRFHRLNGGSDANLLDYYREKKRFMWLGVSTVLFTIELLTSLGLLALWAFAAGWTNPNITKTLVSVAIVAVGYYAWGHARGSRLAKAQALELDTTSVTPGLTRAHNAGSIDDCHRDMLELLTCAGLVAFSGFTLLAGLGDLQLDRLGAIGADRVRSFGAHWLAWYMWISSTLMVATYIRIRLAVGRLSKMLDPTDRSFRLLHVDDSLFGFAILLSLSGFDLLVLLSVHLPESSPATRAWSCVLVCGIMLLCERAFLFAAGRERKASVAARDSVTALEA